MTQTASISNFNNETDEFAREIDEGLSQGEKHISSKYFYDEKGDFLFTQIMDLDEYYLTRSEFEVFETKKEDIYRALPFGDQEFDLVELGAGDGSKTKVLLEYIFRNNQRYHYMPIDISENSLTLLTESLSELFPVKVTPFNYQYLDGLTKTYMESPDRPKLILFLGSNIGNLPPEQALEFLKALNKIKKPDDLFLIGIDLKKDPKLIRAAYNDSKGITAQFNLNVLHRINRELKGNFDVNSFIHSPEYDPETGAARSYLVSTKKQTVRIGYIDKEYHFEANERIYTEISQKYSLQDFEQLTAKAGLTVFESFLDSNEYFADILLK